MAGHAVEIGASSVSRTGLAFRDSGTITSTPPGGEQSRDRDRDGTGRDVVDRGEVALPYLLTPGRVLEVDHLDGFGIVEVGDRWIVEREMAVLADTRATEIEWVRGEQVGVAPRFGLGIVGPVEVVECAQREVGCDAFAHVALKAGRVPWRKARVLVHVERSDGGPVDVSTGDELGEERELAVAGREQHVRLAARLDRRPERGDGVGCGCSRELGEVVVDADVELPAQLPHARIAGAALLIFISRRRIHRCRRRRERSASSDGVELVTGHRVSEVRVLGTRARTPRRRLHRSSFTNGPPE